MTYNFRFMAYLKRIMAYIFRFRAYINRNLPNCERILLKSLELTFSASKEVLPTTAVSRNGEVWDLSEKGKVLIKSFCYICKGLVLVHRHFLKPRNVKCNIFSELTLNDSLLFFQKKYIEIVTEKYCVISEI